MPRRPALNILKYRAEKLAEKQRFRARQMTGPANDQEKWKFVE
jgi:hypothetical protein